MESDAAANSGSAEGESKDRPERKEGTAKQTSPDEGQLNDLVVLDDDEPSPLPKGVSVKVEDEARGSEAAVSSASSKNAVKSENIPTAKPSNADNQKAVEVNCAKQIPEPEKVCDALILTDTELETDMTFAEKERNAKKLEAAESAKREEAPMVSRRTVQQVSSKVIWVSNITRSVKATDLKCYLSKAGRVVTAKVVTDGKRCFGYIVMDTVEEARECLRLFSDAQFDGRKVSLSSIRPDRNAEKTPRDNTKTAPTEEGGDAKASKRQQQKEPPKKRRSLAKHLDAHDPLTTKFKSKSREGSADGSSSGEKSCSAERQSHTHHHHHRKEYLQELNKIKWKLMEDQRRNRQEIRRQIEREGRAREMEFKLEQERRELKLERELFERERRELTRLDAERRKLEREKLEVLQERAKLEEDKQRSKLKSFIVKPHQVASRKDEGPPVSRSKASGGGGPKKMGMESSVSSSSSAKPSHRAVASLKPDRSDFKLAKENRSGGGPKPGKDYEHQPPPPPDLSSGRSGGAKKRICAERTKHEQPFVERQNERGVHHKIEVVDRKYYSDRKYGRKLETNRKYEYGRETAATKRYRSSEEGYQERQGNPQRMQWPVSNNVGYGEPWRAGPACPSVPASSAPRYQEGCSFSSAGSYGGGGGGGGTSRIPPFYCQPVPAPQEYRYEHGSQSGNRKY